jgi:hypothetical protein
MINVYYKTTTGKWIAVQRFVDNATKSFHTASGNPFCFTQPANWSLDTYAENVLLRIPLKKGRNAKLMKQLSQILTRSH